MTTHRNTKNPDDTTPPSASDSASDSASASATPSASDGAGIPQTPSPTDAIPDTGPAPMATPSPQDQAARLLSPHQGRTWVAAHCKPRSEKLVAQQCDRLGIPHYLPLRRTVHRYTRKVATFDVPLFPGYVFCAIDDQTRLALLRSNRIVRFLSVPPDLEPTFLDELRQIFLATHLTDAIDQADFDPRGKKVLILTGPLAGLTGRVVERRGKARPAFILNLGLLQQAAQVHIDLDTTKVEFLE